MMRDRDNPAVIIRYLLDLDEIMTDHDKSGNKCFECAKHGFCVFKSTLSVEIMTYQRKLLKYARIV